MTQSQLAETVATFFAEDDWPISFDMDAGRFDVGFQGTTAQWKVVAFVLDEEQQVIVYSECPVAAPAGQVTPMAEFITRANFGLLLGNFEMDMDSGVIRYKTGIDVEGGTLTTQMVRHLVYANIQGMDRYLPGIMAVLTGGVSPAEAIEQAENAPFPGDDEAPASDS